jgi:hypothetical protein
MTSTDSRVGNYRPSRGRSAGVWPNRRVHPTIWCRISIQKDREHPHHLKICYPVENKQYNSCSPMPSSTHVPNQLHGYSLQFTECVSVLVDAAIGDSVSVEVLDDVALRSEGGKTGLIQTKAGTGANPISDGALEMWKSFRNWIDQINAKEIDPNKSTFTLYVGAFHKGKLCSLMSAARTTAEVDDALKKIEAKFITPATKKFRKELGKEIREQVEVVLDPKNRKQLALIVSKFDYRHGSGDSYVDLRSKFAKMAIQDSLLDLVMDRMAGWTKRCIDNAIENGKPPIVEVKDFREELNSYHVKLINQPFLERFTEETLVTDHAQHSWKLYYRQLTLIEADSTELMEAVGNYLSARAHAVRYVREGIINETSLPDYAKELNTLWMNLKKKWELQATTKGDVHFGKSLLNDCSLQKTKLQGGDVPTFFMCGCFHELANHLEIGWHPKFLELLGGGNAAL